MKDIIRVKTISEVHELLGLEKPKHPLVSVLHHQDSKWQEHHYANERVSLDMYQVTLKMCSPGSFEYGRNSYDFREGTMIFTGPGQVFTIHEMREGDAADGWTLLFHPDLIRKSELGKSIDDYSFFSYDVHEALHLSDDEKKTIQELVSKIEKEYQQNIDKHSQKLIISNIQLILDYCTRYYDRQFYVRTNLNKDVVTRFEQLLKSYFNEEKPVEGGIPTVRYCGTEMGMSPNYLSDLLKKETGRNAQEHIHYFVIDKAKTRLLNSTESISQIAYSLGFEYPQHFSKIFKAKTGMSPAEYRNVN